MLAKPGPPTTTKNRAIKAPKSTIPSYPILPLKLGKDHENSKLGRGRIT